MCTRRHAAVPTALCCPQTLSNLGDALVALACAQCQAGDAAGGSETMSRAEAAYRRACELSDSADGDDLPGLLCNWSCGLRSASQHVPVSGAARVRPCVLCRPAAGGL